MLSSASFDAVGRGRRRTVARINRAAANPLLEVGQHGIAELTRGRHLQVLVLILHRRQQAACRWLAGNEDFPVVATPFDRRPVVEHEPAFDFGYARRMALVTMLDQHGTNPFLEELDRFGRRLRGRLCHRCRGLHRHEHESCDRGQEAEAVALHWLRPGGSAGGKDGLSSTVTIFFDSNQIAPIRQCATVG